VAGLFPQIATFAFADKTLALAVVDSLNDLRKTGYYDALFDRYGVLKIEEPQFALKGPGPA
jgi:polar amino acid transport system substrate-binding protein